MVGLRTTNGTGNLLAQADGAARHAKLLQAAQEFEAIMLEVILKPLGKPAAIDSDENDTGSTGPMQSFGVEAVAGSLARSDALGVAGRIVASVERHDPRSLAEETQAETPATVSHVPLGTADTPERR